MKQRNGIFGLDLAKSGLVKFVLAKFVEVGLTKAILAKAILTKTILAALIIASGISSAQAAKKQASISNASVTIRTMTTGEFLYAGGKKDDVNWNVVEVPLPGYLSKKYPFGAVQFQHIKQADKCLISNGFWTALGDCAGVANGDHRTLFSLLPTSSGAFQIQSIAAEGCLVAESNFDKKNTQSLKIAPCYNDIRVPIDLHWLWILTPPIIDAKPSSL
ncbi:hypothetical protein BKN38_05715 [Helicobacter sp. CLO-3]|uniref:hypothetical protein n=1 Tax=unclassified Helicobacter TaxID=2593540 RepID=UPI000805AF6D|nr:MULTISPECIES: hypothetical protein [unclassified Helicobacter]OBV29976.1 hypothetical protein BA723_03235 [Helicobacter sp. CLO-3]OHU83204.1 hypothetical protein BKN38_05715 [Helicobacter sp. CLO-3]